MDQRKNLPTPEELATVVSGIIICHKALFKITGTPPTAKQSTIIFNNFIKKAEAIAVKESK